MGEPSPEAAILLLSEATRASRSRPPATLEDEVAGLFDEFRNRLLRYLFSFGLQVQDGEEVIQEVFLALFLHLQQGRSRTNLRGWVFRVAHNLALKRRAHAGAMLLDPGNLGGSKADLLIDSAPNAEDEMASRQEQQRLAAVLRALPEQDRRCLALRAEGLNYREIAEVLGISLGTVSAVLSRSLARFARASER